MLDIKRIRENPQSIADSLLNRGFRLDVEHYENLESQRKTLQQKVEGLQAERNRTAKQIGELKRRNQDLGDISQRVSQLGQELEESKQGLQKVQQQLEAIHQQLPNLPDKRAPLGKSEDDNQEVFRWGEPKKIAFTVKDHVDLAEQRNWLDFTTASQLATSRYSLLKGDLAKLHRALAQFMLDYHIDNYDYEEISSPLIVNQQALYGTGQLPKFEEDLFQVTSGDKKQQDPRRFYLIPTAEVPLTNLVAEKMLVETDLPMRFVAHTVCFRSEAGNSGKDTRGLIRQHQFEKVELVNICRPQDSWDCLEKMVSQAEQILKQLELPYRKISLCTADIGFAAAFTYDLEVWLPSQQAYREISSVSNCLDFQARRMQSRFKNSQGQREYVHTLNGSGVAVGRALVAVLENHQLEDGRIAIPECLRGYLNNRQTL